MFSYTGLTPSQVYALKDKYHVYLLKSGRASISGRKQHRGPIIHPNPKLTSLFSTTVSPKNVNYVARAIDEVVRNIN